MSFSGMGTWKMERIIQRLAVTGSPTVLLCAEYASAVPALKNFLRQLADLYGRKGIVRAKVNVMLMVAIFLTPMTRLRSVHMESCQRQASCTRIFLCWING